MLTDCRTRVFSIVAVALMAGLTLVASESSVAQEKGPPPPDRDAPLHWRQDIGRTRRTKISWSTKRENAKSIVRQELWIPNITGHVIRLTEFRRTWPDGGAPTVAGQKVVEEIARGFMDVISGNGRASGYWVWRFESGDLMLFGEYQTAIQTVVNMSDGSRKTTFMGTYVTTGGTGRLKDVRGFARLAGVLELDAEPKVTRDESSAEGEYWFDK
jgi:hypothetical protein